MKKNYTREGFTLIELLVVLAIIGLLSVLSVMALGSARKKANDAKRLSDIKQIQTALELYFTDNNSYPFPHDGASLGGGEFGCISRQGFAPVGCADAYLDNLPRDPAGGSYGYSSQEGADYTMRSSLEAGAGSLKKGGILVKPSGISQ